MVIECFLWGAEAEVNDIYCLFQVIIDQSIQCHSKISFESKGLSWHDGIYDR